MLGIYGGACFFFFILKYTEINYLSFTPSNRKLLSCVSSTLGLSLRSYVCVPEACLLQAQHSCSLSGLSVILPEGNRTLSSLSPFLTLAHLNHKCFYLQKNCVFSCTYVCKEEHVHVWMQRFEVESSLETGSLIGLALTWFVRSFRESQRHSWLHLLSTGIASIFFF